MMIIGSIAVVMTYFLVPETLSKEVPPHPLEQSVSSSSSSSSPLGDGGSGNGSGDYEDFTTSPSGYPLSLPLPLSSPLYYHYY